MQKQKLTYKRIFDSVLEIDLHNGYKIIAMYLSESKEKFKVSLYIKGEAIDVIDLMDDKEDGFSSLKLEATYKTICPAILKEVSNLFYSGRLNYYMDRYQYMFECFDVGDEILTKERSK